jgi:hypothetical protein
VLADILLREEAGEPLDLSSVVRAYPDLESRLREYFCDRDAFRRIAEKVVRNGETVSEDDYRGGFPSWSRDESALGPGSTIPLQAGLYCVESEIGTGGMGEVYAAL